MANSFSNAARQMTQKMALTEEAISGHQAGEEPAKTKAKTTAKTVKASKAPKTKPPQKMNETDVGGKADEYTSLNFRVTRERKRRLQMYAIEHDTTLVSLLNSWIDSL